MIRVLLDIFNKRRVRGIFGIKDRLDIEIFNAPNEYYDKVFISSINLPKNKSPKIILSSYQRSNTIDVKDTQENRMSNIRMFQIIENIDYIYEWHIKLNKAFEVSDFPMNKILSVTKLQIEVENLEKLQFLI